MLNEKVCDTIFGFTMSFNVCLRDHNALCVRVFAGVVVDDDAAVAVMFLCMLCHRLLVHLLIWVKGLE